MILINNKKFRLLKRDRYQQKVFTLSSNLLTSLKVPKIHIIGTFK
jgi:hypothetical protein